MTAIAELWDSADEERWKRALEGYWTNIKPSELELEHYMDTLDSASVQGMEAEEWFEFLLHKYFRWKYTAKNRYGSTTKNLRQQAGTLGLDGLLAIRDRMFQASSRSVKEALETAGEVKGLGTAGASGLLAVLFPHSYGTVDQFVVKALRTIRSLPEQAAIARMKPECLTTRDGCLLIELMRNKASSLNTEFGFVGWTPRKIDMVLWASER